ncbi:MAG TPA: hypothetical protein DCS66_15200 [Flavobacteriaceae bacterium]|nr:hypothetical protein [Flavobacteriaceae bacterium]HAT65917.1 hypothetical protein [Flavobacteriaceae bacterium]|tara:strand:+ start:50392 stop:51009 length:618 start_codon:yes stop_codon:yes gene_type:complete
MIPIDENFLSNLNLASNKPQFIQSGQVYDSTYGIYGSFQTNDEGNILEINLSIINYKGILELEFDNDFASNCTLIHQENGVYVLFLTTQLRASVSRKTTPTACVCLDNSLEGFKDIGPDDSIYLVVERKLAPIWGYETKNPFKNGVFDNEFFYRDGNRYLPRAVKTIPDNAYFSDLRVVNPDSPAEILGFKPGFKCRNSTLFVLR